MSAPQNFTGVPMKRPVDYEYKKQTFACVLVFIWVFVHAFFLYSRVGGFVTMLIEGQYLASALLLFASVSGFGMIYFYNKSCQDPAYITGKPELIKFWPFAMESVSILLILAYTYILLGVLDKTFAAYALLFFVNMFVTLFTFTANEDEGSWCVFMKPMIRVRVERPVLPVYLQAQAQAQAQGQAQGYGYPPQQAQGYAYPPQQAQGYAYPPQQAQGYAYPPQQAQGYAYPPQQTSPSGYPPQSR